MHLRPGAGAGGHLAQAARAGDAPDPAAGRGDQLRGHGLQHPPGGGTDPGQGAEVRPRPGHHRLQPERHRRPGAGSGRRW
ncbi:MAG: hypothetical protein MZV64_28825 [Ignavibacteriales bacterium]|nr:hypothetical protein [Ignavibacteriales bacterium]